MIQGFLPLPGLVRDVLGRERLSNRVWPDGSYNCPFCAAAVEGSIGHCHNPGCLANPRFPVSVAQRELAKHDARVKDEADREANRQAHCESVQARAAERKAQIQRIQEEAQTKGACVRCALKDAPYRVKFVKHRKTCPGR